jgi:hypothetical protein
MTGVSHAARHLYLMTLIESDVPRGKREDIVR